MLAVFKKSLHICESVGYRTLYSNTAQWVKEYDNHTREELEQYWIGKLQQQDIQQTLNTKDRPKYYVLSMFPYPSGALHMGHVRIYTISDSMARFHRLRGRHVIHPMGWDAFGLPAENAAIDRQLLPDTWTYSNIDSMRKVFDHLCFSFDWSRGYATCDPEYYKWTQNLFLQMYDAGLVYQNEAAVNWDPVDQTVLADEQIDENGKSWRSGATAERKFLKQWYIRATAYSKSLYDGLDDVDPELWRDIITLQRNWIGKPDGTRIEFKLGVESHLSIFSRNAACLYGASHVILSTQHLLNSEQYYRHRHMVGNKQYIELSVRAVHPLTADLLPIYIAPDTDFGEHLDALLSIPSCGDDEHQIADSLGISYQDVIDNNGNLINSNEFSGMPPSKALKGIQDKLKAVGCGGHVTSERGRDWLISRQRYWGTPIPMMHCKKYGTQPVPYDQLPVILPRITEFSRKGHSPLSQAHDWLQVKCANCDCGGFGQRETDTMDTFVDSSWYFLRYLSSQHATAPFDPSAAHNHMPVDLYIGGKEHAIMHLYYARFFMHFLHDRGLVPCREPFKHLLTQGMVMGRSYRLTDSGRYLPFQQVQKQGNTFVEKATGAAVTEDWDKMSKSKYNGVDPHDIIKQHGTEATRLCIISGVAPKSDRLWDDSAFHGVHRWQKRIWSLVTSYIESEGIQQSNNKMEAEETLYEMRNVTVKDVTFHMEHTFLLSTAVSRLQMLTNFLLKMSPNEYSQQYASTLADLIIMISSFTPMFASELWSGMASVAGGRVSGYQWDHSVLEQQWPHIHPEYRLSLKVKKNGKRDQFAIKLQMPLSETGSLTHDQAIALARQHPSFEQCFPTGVIHSNLVLVPQVRAELNINTSKDGKKAKKQLSEKS